MNKRPLILLAVILVALPAVTSAAPMGLNAVQQTFYNATSTWMNKALHLGVGVYVMLATLEFVWWASNRTLKSGELGELLAGAFLKFLSLGFFGLLMIYAPVWIPDVLNSFASAAVQIGGSSGVFQGATLDLNKVFMTGVHLAGSLYQAFGNSGLKETVSIPINVLGQHLSFSVPNMTWVMASMTVLVAAIMCVVAFALIAGQILITLIKAYIAIGGGALMLGFGGSRWTLPFAEKYIGFVVSTGIKIFTLFLITGLAVHVGQGWATEFKNLGTGWQATAGTGTASASTLGPMVFIEIGVEALLMGVMAWMVPSLAGSLMNGSPSMSLGAATATTAAIAGTAATTAALGTAKAMKTADQTIGAAKAGGAVTGVARNAGIGAAFGAAGSALGGAAKDAMSGRGAARASQIAGGLGDKAVSGFGAGTGGGNMANRIRAAGGGAGTGAGAGAGMRNGIEGAGAGVAGKGGSDGFGGNQNAGAGQANKSPLAKKAEELEGERNRKQMPHQGHAGGISIRFKHMED